MPFYFICSLCRWRVCYGLRLRARLSAHRCRKALISIAALSLLFSGTPGAIAQKTTKQSDRDLVTFVQEAKKMGLPDGEIRKTATQAGWTVDAVEKTLTET